MLVLHLYVYVQVIIFNIESDSRNDPAISCIVENVLMKISNTVSIGLVDLSETFICYSLLDRLTINFSIESKFDRIYNVFIELIKRYFTSISLYGLFDMFIYIFIGNEAKVIFMHNSN